MQVQCLILRALFPEYGIGNVSIQRFNYIHIWQKRFLMAVLNLWIHKRLFVVTPDFTAQGVFRMNNYRELWSALPFIYHNL
jgi:hypothetical protein